MTKHKVKEYKDNFKGLWEIFQSRFGNLQELKIKYYIKHHLDHGLQTFLQVDLNLSKKFSISI